MVTDVTDIPPHIRANIGEHLPKFDAATGVFIKARNVLHDLTECSVCSLRNKDLARLAKREAKAIAELAAVRAEIARAGQQAGRDFGNAFKTKRTTRTTK